MLQPVAERLTARPMQALLNVVLTLSLLVLGIIHAILVANQNKANQRADRIARCVRDR